MSACRPLVLVPILALAAAAHAAPAEPFPEFATTRANVEFWTRVWSEWTLGQIVVHDNRRPELIYEIVDLPGPTAERYTADQEAFLGTLKDRWQARLAALEARVAAGVELEQEEKELALLVVTAAGTDALRGAHERVRTQRGLRERFKRGLEISFRYDALFRQIFREERVPEDLAYLPHVESSFQAHARSSAAAVGMWQFTRSAGRKFLRVGATTDERLDPVLAARGAARYLQRAYEELGDWPIALTSYNHGVDGMRRAVETHGPDYEAIHRDYRGRAFGFASRNFYPEFLAARVVARDPARFFPEGLTPEPAFDLEALVLDRPMTAATIARSYGVGRGELAALNPAWTSRVTRSGAVLPVGHTVWLPAGTAERLAAVRAKPRNPSTPVAPAPFVAANGRHTVRQGDTLSGIARTYGMSVAELRRLNALPADGELIRIGDQLAVHDRSGAAEHVVASGETLSSIASRYGVQLVDLLQLNQLTTGTLIRPGQRILIPAAR